jgi:hypothetical protein
VEIEKGGDMPFTTWHIEFSLTTLQGAYP